jgi:hypothetical protein
MVDDEKGVDLARSRVGGGGRRFLGRVAAQELGDAPGGLLRGTDVAGKALDACEGVGIGGVKR